MSADVPPEADADAAPAAAKEPLARRLMAVVQAHRMWAIAGLSALLVLGLLGVAAWFLMASPEKPADKAAPKKPAAAASAAARSDSDPTAKEGTEPAPPDSAGIAERGAEAADGAASAPAPAPALAQAPVVEFPVDAAAAENPMDRLRRRLADKLGSGGKLEEDGAGDLRVVTGKGAAVGAPKPGDAPATPGPAVPAVAWSHEGPAGPAAWGRLHPEFAQCASGKRQSPIDIRDGIKVHLDPVQFSYKPSSFRVLDTGHTVQVNVSAGNFIEVMGRRYELHQFHFHRPSEERIDGKPFDMVVHFVHKDPEGRIAAVAVLLESGSAQPLIQTVWNNLPLEKGDEVVAKTRIDLASLLPAERGYHIYMGSLTTPPCTEGVLWMVMKTPVTLSPAQIDIFARLYPMNARPVQPLAGRLIKESQ